MKKRLCSLILLAAVMVCLIPGTRAAGQIGFVGVNDTIPISLSAEEAPYYSNGVLYIPYTAFNASPNGVYISNNVDQNTLVLFTRSSRLVYDLSAGTVTDEDGNESKVTVNYRNGIMFIPAVQAASHFGLFVALLTSEAGCPIIRFTNGQQVYSNEKFVRNAENLISYILSHNEGESEEGETGENGEENEDDKPQKELGPATVYLAFSGEAVSEKTLELLDTFELRAAFFLTEEQISSQRELVCQIYAAGHTVGLTVEAGEPDPGAALEAANDILDQVLFCRSVLALLPEGFLETASYRILLEQTQAMALDQILQQEELRPRLLVCRSDVAGTLGTLVDHEAFLPQLLETTDLS